jgi:hypothetical protein
MKSNKGSALLVAILLSAILLAALGGLLTVALNEYRGSLKSYFNTAAFSLAESGIDRAAAAIADKNRTAFTEADANLVTDWPSIESAPAPGKWYTKKISTTTAGTTTITTIYRGYFPEENLEKGRKGVCAVTVRETSPTRFKVYARGIVTGGDGIVAQRALEVELESTSSSGSGGGAAVAAQTELKFGTGSNENPFDVPNRKSRLLVASYDSKLNDGRPDMNVDLSTGVVTGDNYGDDAMVGLRAVNGTATLCSGLIYGSVAVGGNASTLSVVSNPKNGCSANEWPSHNPYACSVIDLAAAYGYMGFNLDPAGTGGLGDNVVYNYKFSDSIFQLNGFNTDPQTGAYTTFDTTGYTQVAAINGNNGQALESMNANSSQTVLGPSSYSANDGTKTVSYLSNVAGLGEIVVKGDAVLILSGGANMVNGDGVKLSFVDSTSKLTIVLADSKMYDIKFANADNNISDKDNIEDADKKKNGLPCTNIAGKAYNPDRLTITSSESVKLTMRVGAQKDVAAIVKVPNGIASIDCQDGDKSHQFRGQLIANTIELTGTTYLDIFYDINLGGGGDTNPKITVASWKQILPSAFTAQL